MENLITFLSRRLNYEFRCTGSWISRYYSNNKGYKEQNEDFNFLGFLDDNKKLHGIDIFGYPVLGPLDWLKKNPNVKIFNTIAKNLSVKEEINFNQKQNGFSFINLIHPNVNTDLSTLGDEGILLSKNVYLEAKSQISSHCMILQGSSVGHDTSIGENSFIAPNCNLLGGVKIGKKLPYWSGYNYLSWHKN